MRRRALLCVCVAALATGAATARAGTGLLVGVDDDTPKWINHPNGVVGVERDLGLDAVRMTLFWKRSLTKPTRLEQIYLHRIASTVALGERVVLAVYGPARQAPTTIASEGAYCGFLAHVLERIPQIRDVVVWNEANNPAFWPTVAGAPAYEALVARCFDELHAVRPDVNVIDSTAPHQDPATFIAALGEAYRSSGRDAPLVDTFGHNVYPQYSAEPPWARHDPSLGVIDEGGYGRLVRALRDAFGGTAQPLPGQSATTIWYLEDGFQTAVPTTRRWRYDGHETERRTVSPDEAGSGAASREPSQPAQLRAALELAYCQPLVGAFFNFELLDEHRLEGWQSGILWSDGTPKPAYATFKETIADIRRGAVDCTEVQGAPPQSPK